MRRELFTQARYLSRINATPFYRQYKQRVGELLLLQPGLHVLDVGCGAGQEADAFAAMVQPQGTVVGVDASPAMLQQARPQYPVSFCLGDAHALPFPANAFHRCHADKLCQYLPAPAQAVAEMARVLTPGGMLVMVEPDYRSQQLHLADEAIARDLLDFRCSQQPYPDLARSLDQLFVAAGLNEVTLEPMTWAESDYGVNRWLRLDVSARLARKQGVISAAVAEEWLAVLEEARRSQRFFWSMTYFIATGRN